MWQGFIFVNLAKEPEQSLREFLGPMITAIDYPFHNVTERFYYRGDIRSNWKVFLDAFQEFYHPPILHGRQNPVMSNPEYQRMGFYTMHFQIDGPHRVGSHERRRRRAAAAGSSQSHRGRVPQRPLRPVGSRGPRNRGLPARPQPGQEEALGPRLVPDLPELRDRVLGDGLVPHLPLLAARAQSAAVRGERSTSCPPRNVRERLAHELAATTIKEYALQDCGTLEATQMGLESRVVTSFPLGDQELMCRHLNYVVNKWVDDYRRKHVER